jgi:dipeptidyl aminopeptidase/acylaminoacyl peptidase
MKRILIIGILVLLTLSCARREVEFRTYPLETFFDYKSVSSATYSPDEKIIAYISDASGVHNIWTVPVSGGEPRQLTYDTVNTIIFVTWCPNRDSLVYLQDKGGNENFHLYLMPAQGGSAVELTPGDSVRTQFLKWSYDGNSFLYLSNLRDLRYFDIYQYDLTTGQSKMIYQTKGTEEFADWSRDQKKIAFNIFYVSTDQDFAVYDVSASKMDTLSNSAEEIYNQALTFSPDSKYLYFLTDKDSEFAMLKRLNLETKQEELLEKPDWDVIGAGFSHNGTYFAWAVNQDGSFKIKVLNTKEGKEVPLPALPNGEIRGLEFSRSERYLNFYFNGDRQPTDLYVIDIKNNKLKQLTRSLPEEIAQENLVEGELIRYPSFDGKEIPAYLYKPKNLKPGERRPVIISVHGGPMAQSTKSWSHLRQYLINQGYVVLVPNVRGSTGYGKTYHQLDDKDWGGAPLQDVIYGKKYLSTLDFVDSSKVIIFGGSYGGYMVLAALTFAPTEFAAGVDLVGPSNLTTFLKSIPPYWLPWVKYWHKEIGDPVKDKKIYQERSPLNYADRIVRPLFVIHGANDPRVKQAESDQIVAAARKNNVPVEYMVFPDEGHGLRKKENQIKAFKAVADFLNRYIVQKQPA